MALKIYLIGSLRNPQIPSIARALRQYGHDVFDDWHAAGPEADDYWRSYEIARNNSYREALEGWAAEHVFTFDKRHLDAADVVVMATPAGKSAHLELGYTIGKGKPGYILMDEPAPDRWDVMYKFATRIFYDVEDLVEYLGEF